MSRYLHDPYAYVRRTYGVPAYNGVRVIAYGKPGTIVKPQAPDHYVHILLDGEKHDRPYHPTDDIEYKP